MERLAYDDHIIRLPHRPSLLAAVVKVAGEAPSIECCLVELWVFQIVPFLGREEVSCGSFRVQPVFI